MHTRANFDAPLLRFSFAAKEENLFVLSTQSLILLFHSATTHFAIFLIYFGILKVRARRAAQVCEKKSWELSFCQEVKENKEEFRHCINIRRRLLV